MTNDWPMRGVDDIRRDASDGLATGPFGSSVSSKYFVTEGVPLIRGSNLSVDVGDRLIEDEFVFVTEAKASQFARAIARRGDLVFTCWGTIGQVGLVDDRSCFDKYLVSNKQMKLSPDPLKADSLFLYYLFSSPIVQGSIQNMAIGSSVPGFNLGQLRGIRFPLPPVDEQHAIAAVLGSLDDKIEQNRRTGRALEGLARATFKAWFVDFEPVKAKAAGQSSFPGMPLAAFAALPDHLTDSTRGPVPQGWEVTGWGNVVTLEYGKSLRGYQGGEGPYRVFGTNGPIGRHTECLADGPNIIVGRKGAYRGVHFSPGAFWVIDTAFYVKPKRSIDMKWAYYELLRADINSMDSGSAIPSTSREDFYAIPVCVPTSPLFRAFDSVIGPAFEFRIAAEAEDAKLVALRDYLLPRLLSGRARIPNVEEFIGRSL